MFRDDFGQRRKGKKIKKQKNKFRDRVGKQRKNRIAEQDSIDKFNEGFDEFIDE